MAVDLGPLRIETLFYREADLHLYVEKHAHRVHQWYCCIHGRLDIVLAGHAFSLQPEQSLIVRPGVEREVSCPQRAPGYLVAIFTFAGFDLDQVAHRVLNLSAELRDDVRALVQELRQPGGEETWVLNGALLTRLLIGVARANRDAPPMMLSSLNDADHDAVAVRAEAFMAATCHEPLTRARIAAAVNLSEPHLARVFKAATGKTPLTRLTEIRIARAQALLRESDLSVTTIAGDVGFTAFSHFSQVFRRVVGVSPSDYRRSGGTSYLQR